MPLSFDEQFYLQQNPDVAAAGVSAQQHYEQFGFREGRDPNPFFDTAYYLQQNGDVAAAGVNPFDHFLQNGVTEQRDFTPIFDTAYYLQQNADVAAAGVNPIQHFIDFGLQEQRNVTPFFDATFYNQQNPDVAAAGVNPLEHFLQFGATEQRDPSVFFDMSHYNEQNPDVAAAGINPLEHFVEFGIKELRDPNTQIDMAQIAQNNANFQTALTQGNTDIMTDIVGNAAELVSQGGSFEQALAFAQQDTGLAPQFIPPGGVDAFLQQQGIDPNAPLLPSTGIPTAPAGSGSSAAGGSSASADPCLRADTHVGTTAAEVITGSAGDDVFAGLQGNDTITGGTGSDVFKMNTTIDGIDEIADFDKVHDFLCFNGAAKDYFFTASAGNKIQIKGVDMTAHPGGATFADKAYSNIPTEVDIALASSIHFSSGNIDIHAAGFTVVSSDNLNILAGAAGGQTVTGTSGNDVIQILATGANTIVGGAGDDTLVGYGGTDALNGGAGADYLIGTDGADTFLYLTSEVDADRTKVDTINDAFTNSLGGDEMFDFTDLTNTDLRGSGANFVKGDASGAQALDADAGIYVATNTAASLDEADIYTALAGIADDLGAGDILYVMINHGNDSVLARITESANAGTLVAADDTLEYVATLTGISATNLNALTANNFADFA